MRILLAILLPVCLAAQAPPVEQIHIEGRVLTVAGQPVEGAQVTLLGPRETAGVQPPSASAVTKPDGTFSAHLPPLQYAVSVSKAGYISNNFSLKLEADKKPPELSFRLIPAAAIAGRVLDKEGNPVPRARVTALHYAFTRGARSLNPSGYALQTNERGEYRIPNLRAGRYYLRVEPLAPGVTTYYPSLLDPFAAAALDVEQGVDRTGIDIIQRVESVFRIRGKALNPTGQPAAYASLTILPESPVETLTFGAIPSAPDGSFEFKNLLPGRYTIRATPNGSFSDGNDRFVAAVWAGRMEVAIVRGDIEDLELRVNAGSVLTGTVTMEDGSPFAAAQVSLMDAEQTFSSGNLNAIGVKPETGALRMTGIQPGKFYLRVTGAQNVYVKSVQVGGLDATRSPLDMRFSGLDNVRIVMGSKPGALQVVVRNSKGEAVPRVLVALWPDIRDDGDADSGVRVVPTNGDGVARFPNLRPEKYLVAAFEGVDDAFVRSPEFLDRIRSRATAITLENGAVIERTLAPISVADAAAVIRLIP